jgi:hypothetical protein
MEYLLPTNLTDLQNENKKGFGSKARDHTLEKFRKQK